MHALWFVGSSQSDNSIGGLAMPASSIANPSLVLLVAFPLFTCFGPVKSPWISFIMQAAAMFKILKDTPPIPKNLSSEGKDFLRCCFQRNPAERPSAAMLLEHQFLRNSSFLENPSCSRQASSGIKLAVKLLHFSCIIPLSARIDSNSRILFCFCSWNICRICP